MADPAMAAARAVDELTDEALPGLPLTEVQWLRQRVAELEGALNRAGRHICPVTYISSTPSRNVGSGW